jgi:hypothetical protein
VKNKDKVQIVSNPIRPFSCSNFKKKERDVIMKVLKNNGSKERYGNRQIPTTTKHKSKQFAVPRINVAGLEAKTLPVSPLSKELLAATFINDRTMEAGSNFDAEINEILTEVKTIEKKFSEHAMHKEFRRAGVRSYNRRSITREHDKTVKELQSLSTSMKKPVMPQTYATSMTQAMVKKRLGSSSYHRQ